MFERDLFGEEVPLVEQGSTLSETWAYPPFSVLNAREGWWQERKRQWLALGIKSELGRGGGYGCQRYEPATAGNEAKRDDGPARRNPEGHP